MVALLTEKRITLTKLAQREGVAASTVWRWARRGIGGKKLGTLRVGGRDYTTDALWEEFVRVTTAAANGTDSVIQASSVAASDHAREEAFLAAELG
ncbi:DUF1580 domain-containing protein [Lacipirellula sp.]|uniref:DUF1580 domain-containing protein n=1 Tax=Lacipirellula sp. TaxID=2691419 RepID=UPI003D0F5FEC